MKYPWPDLAYWESGEFQVVQDMLSDITKAHRVYNPDKKNLFSALELTPLENVRVVILGQDPYPSHVNADGLAFSSMVGETFPPTLQTIIKEYENDLHYPRPSSGDLSVWAKRGVLLWNAIPSCEAGKSLSHDCIEWRALTEEILSKTSRKSIPHAFIGSFAKQFAHFVSNDCHKIFLAHPSPRASAVAKTPFLGCRIFSTINAQLVKEGLPIIDWRL
jgi:uracil-DNA glycosylase